MNINLIKSNIQEIEYLLSEIKQEMQTSAPRSTDQKEDEIADILIGSNALPSKGTQVLASRQAKLGRRL